MLITELAEAINTKATEYWNEDEDNLIEKMPTSVVDFVIEQFENEIHFPNYYEEENKADVLSNYINTMAMACVDIFSKYGVEGQTSYSINKSSRNYDSAWITPSLFSNLPNYANI